VAVLLFVKAGKRRTRLDPAGTCPEHDVSRFYATVCVLIDYAASSAPRALQHPTEHDGTFGPPTRRTAHPIIR
jgi:hypothetical protein